MQHLPSPVFLFTSSLMFLFILMGMFDKCLHRSLTNISGNHERWALLQGQIWGEATSLKFLYICHFLNNYDLNKGRFIVSRSPGRLPRGFCISNQRLFVLSGWTPPSSTSWSIPPSSPSSCTPSTLLKNGEQPMCSSFLAGSKKWCISPVIFQHVY